MTFFKKSRAGQGPAELTTGAKLAQEVEGNQSASSQNTRPSVSVVPDGNKMVSEDYSAINKQNNGGPNDSLSRQVYRLNPLDDERWNELLKIHPRSSVFHTTQWLEALRRTYGYEPCAFTTSPPGSPLRNAAVFCLIDSWMTGRRLVSVPFADHCALLTQNPEDVRSIFAALEHVLKQEKLVYFEFRPTHLMPIATPLWCATEKYYFHQIDLHPTLEVLFRSLHKDSIQRKIKRAEKEGITYREGGSDELLDDFFRLFVSTRRRHRVPPQPKAWFHNLIGSFGDKLKIRVAYKGNRPIASILTIRHKDALIYKYGCSDSHMNKFGGIQLLLWRAIQEAKDEGLKICDLGRSDVDNEGLIAFKERWGATRSTLTYQRFAAHGNRSAAFGQSANNWKFRMAKHIFALTPNKVLSFVGNILYKHMG
jgi:lipid II:glycine glycyltransferase (peptidoglycan interpeptide bridge formation enzyme)